MDPGEGSSSDPVKNVKEKPDSESDIDFFASSEEDETPKAKPKLVPPKPKVASANTSEAKKKVEVLFGF